MRKCMMLASLVTFTSLAGISQQTRGIGLFAKFGYTSIPGIHDTYNTGVDKAIVDFKNYFVFVSAEANYRRDFSMYILDASIGAQEEQYIGKNHYNPFLGSAMFKYGYVVHETDKITIYPTLGTGVWMQILTAWDEENNIIVNQRVGQRACPGAEVSIQADFMPENVSDEERIRTGAVLGIAAALRFISVPHRWPQNSSFSNVQNDYPQNLVGFSIAIKLGVQEIWKTTRR